MFSKLKRIGAKSCKVQLTIDLKELDVFDERDDITLVCVELKRGSKSISSASRLCSERELSVIKFDDQLLLFMTLYKDSTGKYIEKGGILNLNGHSNVTNSTVLLGSVKLKLNQLASDFEAQKLHFTFVDSSGYQVGTLSATATSKFVGDGTVDDDDSSNVSGASTQSYTEIKDVRYGSVYRDTAGITDPEISTKTTDKFRNNILRRNSGLSPDQDDGGASSDSCDTSKSFLRRNDKENTSRQMDLSKRKMKNDEGKIPRGKSSLAIGPKDEEIADLYRELEQANKRAATAQQEQRNISAVIASDTRKHENSEIEFRKQIILLQNEIHGLNSITNTTRITDVDYVCGDLGGNPASDAPAEEGKCESCEGEIEELRSLVESLRRKLKGSMANEMATAGELIKLRAVLISTNSKHDAECAKLAVWTAAVETSGAAEAEAVGVARGEPVTGTMMSPALYGELSSNDTVANAVFLQSKIDLLMEELRVAHKSYEVLLAEAESKDAELDALRVERTQVAAGLCEILSQNEKLTSACAELRRTMSEREKESNRRHATNSSTAHAESESDVIKDLRIQLSIKRISENGLLLREMQDLQEEVRSLQQENSLLTDLQESVKIGGAKYAELSMSKSTLEDSLVLSNSTVATLTGEAEILKVLVVDLFRNIPSNKCPETVSLRRRITDLKIKIEPEKTVEDQERKFQNDLESSDSGPENSIIESDIEKQILGSEEEVMRMKERREGLKKSKLLIHDSSDKVEGMGVSRRREIAALRALNRDLEERLLTAERLLVAAEAKAAERAESSEEEEEDEDERCCMFKDRTEHLSRDGSKGTERSADSLHDKDALYIDGNRDRDRVLSTALSHPTSHAHPRSTDSATSCSDQGRDSQLVQRIFALENAAEMEKRKFEGRIRILLKLSGMYDSTYSNFIAGSDHSDDRWKEVVRAQSDLERKKVMTLKTILMRFTSKLTADEVDELEDCGVILAPRSRPRNRGLNLGSALCFV